MAITTLNDDAVCCVLAHERDPGAALPCPSCGAPNVSFDDRSARPFSLWYAVECRVCGMSEIAHVSVGGARPALI